jgi:hypothetical protein
MEAQSIEKSLQAEKAQRAKTAKDLEKLQLVNKRLEHRLVQQEQTSQTSTLQTAELQAAVKDARDALTRETDKCSRFEKAMVDLKETNRELQKELDELVKDDTGRSGEVCSASHLLSVTSS